MTSLEREIERVADRAIRDSRLAGGAPLGILDGLEAFFAAINFTEPIIVATLAVHVVFLLLAVLTRKRTEVQIALLGVALLTVLSATHINSYGSRHWKALGFSQNYFDATGVFTSIMLSLPMIVTSFFMLIHAVVRASNLLIVVKRKQLGVDKRDKAATAAAKAEAAAAKAGTASSSSSSATATPVASVGSMRVGDVDGDEPTSTMKSAELSQRKAAKTSSKKKART